MKSFVCKDKRDENLFCKRQTKFSDLLVSHGNEGLNFAPDAKKKKTFSSCAWPGIAEKDCTQKKFSSLFLRATRCCQ